MLAGFAVAALAAVIYAARVNYPGREEAVRRLERASGIPHRPASSYEDTITANAEDPRTSAIWQAHRARLAAAMARLRVGPPHPRTDRADPVALRALLLLGVVAVASLVGDSAADRLRSAFRFNSLAALASARLDAWVTPPSYTTRPPVMLADGARGGTLSSTPAKLIEVPERSVLIVRATGSGLGELSLEVLNEGATEKQHVAAKAPEAGKSSGTGAEISELRYELRKSAEVRVLASGAELARWPFYVIPDKAPKIALTKDPERTRRGALKLDYTVEDDYGVVSAEVKVRRPDPEKKAADPAKDWARPEPLKGARLPLEHPPTLTLRLPRGNTHAAQTYIDTAPHPYAGREVILTLEARDVAGNVGRSKPIRIVLPQRQFDKPLARALIEQRGKLLDDFALSPAGAARARRPHDGARGLHRQCLDLSEPAHALARAGAGWLARGLEERDRRPLGHRAAHRGRRPVGRGEGAARRAGQARRSLGERCARFGNPEPDAAAARCAEQVRRPVGEEQ